MKSVLKKNRFKGFTLVEVMTSLVIMTILIAVASGVIIVTFDIFGRSAVRRAAQNNGNNVYNYIYDHLSYATALKIDQTVDINIEKENKDEVKTEGAKAYVPDEGTRKLIGEEKFKENADTADDSKKYEVNTYFERLIAYPSNGAMADCMKLNRKDVNTEVFVYGKQDKADSSKIVNTMNGCDCIISFDEYKFDESTDDALKPDTIGFSVTIKRDDEIFYERKGSIPILNKELKDHINISKVDNDLSKIEIFYTYIW